MTALPDRSRVPLSQLMRSPSVLFKTFGVWVAWSVLVGGAARAESPGPNAPPVQVVAIRSDDLDEQAEALTAALRSRVRALRGFSLAEGDSSLEVLTLGLKCTDVPDEACQIKIGNQLHAERYVWGTVKHSKTIKQVIADLHLWTRGRPSAQTSLTYSDNLTSPGDEALKRLVDAALAHLLSANQPVSSGPLVPAVDLARASASSRPPIVLRSAPVAASAPKSSNEPAVELHGDGNRTTGWAAIGLGGVLIAGGVYSFVRLHDIDTNDRYVLYGQGFGEGTDVCSQARAGLDSKVAGAATPGEMQDLCSQASTFKTLQIVFFAVGAVSAGAGIYLLASDKSGSSAQSKWTFTPAVGKNGGRVQLGVSF